MGGETKMTDDNSAIVKIVANHTREYAELQTKYKNLMEVHLETLKKYQAVSIKYDDLKNEIVHDFDLILRGKIAAPIFYQKYLGWQ